MENKKVETYPNLTKSTVMDIVNNLEGKYEYTYLHNQHSFHKQNESVIHAFETGQSFIFSIRSDREKDQELILDVLTEQYPFDMSLYEDAMSNLCHLYQSTSFTVEPLKIEKINNFSWLSFFNRKKGGRKQYWENFDHFYYECKLYPWKKNIINLSVTQLIKMIIVTDVDKQQYIPVMETSLPLNDSKRTKICISLDRNFPNIYVLQKNGSYETETLENILKMVNKGIRNYIYNILRQRHSIDITKDEFAVLDKDAYKKYIILNEMAMI